MSRTSRRTFYAKRMCLRDFLARAKKPFDYRCYPLRNVSDANSASQGKIKVP
ncbi:hypothetical protein WN51_07406 [Melipona quadrifasciata]|uniref:Uncharacterized protein n=1 Tax=Melipona quadrifasciata TaxID=166423 RepID=A0A0N1IT45_9HYME|nr:hypothetical protein WN51_07406 [Melipona quadrifasciata]